MQKNVMIKRKIEINQVIDTIQFPDLILQKNNRKYFRKFGYNIEAVCIEKKHIKVLTVYWI